MVFRRITGVFLGITLVICDYVYVCEIYVYILILNVGKFALIAIICNHMKSSASR